MNIKNKYLNIIIIFIIISSCLYFYYSQYEHKQYLKNSLQNFNEKKTEKRKKYLKYLKNNHEKESVDFSHNLKSKKLSYKDNLKRYESSTPGQKACVKTLGNGIYKRESLFFKLDMCNVPYKIKYD